MEIKLSVEKELPDAGGHLDLAGVRVMFRSYACLYSRGTLSAVGTETDSIRFMPHIKEGDHQKIRLKGIGRWLKC
ncbi:hypothetical protein DRP53_02445 [candidate division WOR-3 bacterium]|uniref:Uncharacterized protein n=1 Tax=candidate division WOR-3 bacterium TaxID=2052148 RepID=A0A660SM87_UNCW3|nr:MAG: hypothetical protein DRP53_02445 [candidate division WOR-3 bacterium]